MTARFLIGLFGLACFVHFTRTPISAQGNAGLPDTSRVQVLTLSSQVFRNTRSIRVYLPPGYFDAANNTRRYPILYLNDGFSLFRYQRAPAVADSLINASKVAPFILVGIDNAASIVGENAPLRARANEYLPYPEKLEPDLPAPEGRKYPEFLLAEVVPLVESKVRALSVAAERGIGGASYGAIAALHSAIERPGAFGLLLLESPPLFISDGRLLSESKLLHNRLERVYVGMGGKEAPSADMNDALLGAVSAFGVLLKNSAETRYQFNRVETHQHNSDAWRERLPAALVFLFGY